MIYSDFECDKAYKVVLGDNGTLKTGDIIWVDSVSRALNNSTAKGWLTPDECIDCVFSGVTIEPALDYKVTTYKSGTSRCEKVYMMEKK